MNARNLLLCVLFGSALTLAVAGVMVAVLAGAIDDYSFSLSQFGKALVQAIPCGVISSVLLYVALRRRT